MRAENAEVFGVLEASTAGGGYLLSPIPYLLSAREARGAGLGATAPRQENCRGRASRGCAVPNATLKRASCGVSPVARPLAALGRLGNRLQRLGKSLEVPPALTISHSRRAIDLHGGAEDAALVGGKGAAEFLFQGADNGGDAVGGDALGAERCLEFALAGSDGAIIRVRDFATPEPDLGSRSEALSSQPPRMVRASATESEQSRARFRRTKG